MQRIDWTKYGMRLVLHPFALPYHHSSFIAAQGAEYMWDTYHNPEKQLDYLKKTLDLNEVLSTNSTNN